MIREELESLIAEVQHRQSELNDLEVKSARAGTPKRLYEALSAFANRTGGGVVLLGLDESADFSVVGVKDAHRLQSDIGDLASSEMEPALRPEFTVEDIGGKTVVAVEIGEIPTTQRPCYLLKKLTERGDLSPQGKGKGRRYVPKTPRAFRVSLLATSRSPTYY